MINIIIASFNEPKSTSRAIKTFLMQKIPDDFKIIVMDPFPETENFLKKEINDNRVSFFLDSGDGKSYALNLLLQKIYSKNKDDLIILTDGDVYVSENTVKEVIKAFKDEKIGVVTSKPVSLDSRDNKYGYWSYVLRS